MMLAAKKTPVHSRFLGLVATVMLVGCGAAVHHQAAEPEPTAAPGAATSGEISESEAATAPSRASADHVGGSVQADQSQAATQDLMPDTPPDPSRALPEVTLKRVGMHIGGESNDAATKEPFLRAIEARSEDFLRCYRKVLQPQKGGVFGVDLFIRRPGGHPEVRQPRTGMKGDEFRKCMLDVFESVNFERPAMGPAIISYSMKFEVSGAESETE